VPLLGSVEVVTSMSADPQQDDEVLVLESMYELGKELIWESTAPREGRILVRGDGSVPEHGARP
jgi:hypothetical protein